MRAIHFELIFVECFIIFATSTRLLADSPSPEKPTDGQLQAISNEPTPPLWLPIRKPSADQSSTTPPPASVYSRVWLPECQKAIGLSAEQKKALLEINERRSKESKENFQQNQALTQEQLKAKSAEIQQWRLGFENGIRKEIENVLTPEQLRMLKEYSFPQQAIALIQTPKIRQDIGFTQEQEDTLNRLRKERQQRIQLEHIEQADKIWNLMDPEQQAELPELVKRQGPTSAALSIGWELGFDFEGLIAAYPMLAVVPARERLNLTAEQAEQLRAVMADATKRTKALREGLLEKNKSATRELGSEEDEKKRVEVILTPQQLKTINELDFRRKVVLALGYPEKRKTIRMTERQEAELQRLTKEIQVPLYRMDQEINDQAIKILTPRQRELLRDEIEKHGW